MAEVTRSSRLAVVTEVAEGTPVAPSAGTDYLALQDGFELTPAFNELENAELSGSIGFSKTVLGIEEPSLSISHYLRHSGVEGQEPNFGKLIEACLGDKEVEATEYNTIAGSTAGTASVAGTVVVDAGEGAQFERGQPLLIKDGVNGYQIRCVDSISTDTLSLNFNLSNAPALGVDLGKAVLYKPADGDHPTLSAWLYRGNGGAVELMSGGRSTDMTIEIVAGEFINASFTVEGNSYRFNPVEITATTDSLDFNDGGAQSITLPVGFYKDPHEAASALGTAMSAVSSDTITVTYSDATGLFTTATDGASLAIDWATTTDTLGAAFGYTADDTGSLTYDSDSAYALASPQTPSFDSANPLVAKNNQALFGGIDDISCISLASATITVTNTRQNIESICSESGVSGSIFSSREVTIELDALLSPYDADKFKRFRNGETTKFQYVFGEKSGGNWIAGKCGVAYLPTATISEFSLADRDGLVAFNMTLRGFVDNSQGEFYLGFV